MINILLVLSLMGIQVVEQTLFLLLTVFRIKLAEVQEGEDSPVFTVYAKLMRYF